MVAPSPKEGVFRVLVGPLADADAIAKTRTNLEKAGFDGGHCDEDTEPCSPRWSNLRGEAGCRIGFANRSGIPARCTI